METYTLLGMSSEDYNTALFEIGCTSAEKQYSPIVATKLKGSKMYWKWLNNQRQIVDNNYYKLIERGKIKPGSRQAFDSYYLMLTNHIDTVYFSEQLKKELIKEVYNG